MTTPGLHRMISNEAYHSGPGISNSGLKRVRKSPWHFHAIAQALAEEQPAPPAAPTPQMLNGTLTHCALLEPACFDQRYVVCEHDKRTKAYKEFAEAHPGVTLITQLQRDQAHAQARSLLLHPRVAELMVNGEPEVSAYWIDEATQVLCKCRPDWVSRGWGDKRDAVMLLDVKTTSDAGTNAFMRSVTNFGYHHQADWYCHGYERATGAQVLGMVFAVVESEFPYAARTFMLSDRSLLRARDDNRAALNLYASCEAAGLWPGYPEEITVIDLPEWAYKEAA